MLAAAEAAKALAASGRPSNSAWKRKVEKV
jgi:hypothetical protein